MKLNFGCGKDIKKGYVNLDHIKLPGVDVCHDLNSYPYPFKDNPFEEILCKGSLEYAKDVFRVMEELHRIAKPDAMIKIDRPYWHSSATYPHITTFNVNSFDYFTEDNVYSYYTHARFKVLRIKLVPSRLGRLIPPIPLPKSWFENIYDLRHLVSYLLGEIIMRVYFELRVLK